jgi:hypothetical protein
MLDIRQLLKSNLFKKKMTSLEEDLLEDDSSRLPKMEASSINDTDT